MQKFFLNDPVYSEPNYQVLLKLENNVLNRQLRIEDSLKRKLSPTVFSQLNENERIILQYTLANGRVNTSTAIKITQKSRATAIRTLKSLGDRGLLIWHGANSSEPTQYYTLE